MRILARLLLLVAALAWAAFVLVRADLPAAWAALAQSTSAGQRWLLVGLFLIPSGIALWLDTHGWLACFGADRPQVPFSRLATIRLAGEAVNQATPFLSLGGEPVKAVLLVQEGATGAQG